MEEDEDMLPPFWLQSNRSGGRRRRLHRSYSLMISSGAFLICIIITACVIVFIVLPTLRSFASHIFRPQLVKKSWDSLNLVLVLFAIVCGFLSRNSNETPRSYEDRRFSEVASAREFEKLNPETPTRRWYEYSEPDRTAVNRLRSFNSYPDLRQESLWIGGDERWRFYDDTSVGGYRGSDLDDHRQLRHRRVRSEVIDEEYDAVKNIAVDTFVVKEVPIAPLIPETRQPPPSPHPLAQSPPQVQHTEDVRKNGKRTYHATGRSGIIEKEEKDEFEVSKSQPPYLTTATSSSSPAVTANADRKNSRRTYRSSRQAPLIEKDETIELEVRNFSPQPPRPSIPPPPPPPPLPLFYQSSEKKKKRGSATKEFLTSLRGKKKKQRQKSIDNFETLLNSQAPHLPPSTPPPPPPPPPPPSVFYNLFSPKKPKHKKVHSIPPPPSAPPPPVLSTRVQKPLISNEREIFNSMEGNILTGNESPFHLTGNESPFHRIPPPPPPPPFGIPAWKFRVQGDFVRISSVRTSRSNSPDIDDDGGDSSPTIQDQPATPPPLFCPSPDVDTKADTFIARFRAGLKLEKMNSMKKSNLGPS